MERRHVGERHPALERREQPAAVVRERAAEVIRAGLGQTAGDDPQHGERRGREHPGEALRPEPEEPRPEHRERDPENDRAAAVGAEPVVRHHDEAEDAEDREAENPEAATREVEVGGR